MWSSRAPARAAALAAALLVAAGCGYRFQGQHRGLPGGAETIAVPILENPTLEPELGAILAAAIRDQFARTTTVRLVPTDDAATVLRGRIERVESDAIAFDPQGLVVEYRLIVTLRLLLTDRPEGRILWADPALTSSDTYLSSSDPLVTEASRREAIRRIAADLGRSVRDRVIAGF